MKYYIIEDICVMCGAPVAEGAWVCPCCMTKANEKEAGDRISERMRVSPKIMVRNFFLSVLLKKRT